MLENIIRKVKKISIGIALASVLTGCATFSPRNNWLNIQPAYNFEAQHRTVRLEGGTNLTKDLSVYSYSDIDATKEKPTDFESFYNETRLNYLLRPIDERLKEFGLAVEYNGGTGTKDVLRFGLTHTTKVGDGNFTLLKFYPIETSGDLGMQVGLYTSQKLTDRLKANLLVDFNLKLRTIYAEPEIDIDITDILKLFCQARISMETDKPKNAEISPVIGLKCDF